MQDQDDLNISRLDFFMKDKVAQKEVEVKYCPTKKIWPDAMTKPQHGPLFQEMQAIIMNFPVNSNKGNTKVK